MCILRALILPTVSYGLSAVMGIAVYLWPRAKGVGSLSTRQVGVSGLFGYFPLHLGLGTQLHLSMGPGRVVTIQSKRTPKATAPVSFGMEVKKAQGQPAFPLCLRSNSRARSGAILRPV